jgi:hypothetical protein
MLASLALAAFVQVAAPQVQELAPGTQYDPAIPTLEQVAGHDFREEITPPDAIVRYMEALARAAPQRTRLVRYAESWEGRPLVLLVIGSAARMARLDEVKAGLDLLSTAAEKPEPTKTPDQPIEYLQQIVPADEAPEEVPGSILRVVLDREHWLSAGTDGEIGVLVEGTRVFSPITLDHGTNVGRYAGVDSLVLSGVVWDESRPQLASKAFLMDEPTGSGQVIAFAEDPNYRAYAEETELLFMNAVLLGPGR